MDETKRMMHIGIKAGDIGRYVLLPGSPERAELIAGFFDDAEEKAYNREYRTFTGFLNGEKVSVTSTGMGGPSLAIAVEELVECGADTLVRVGTSESTTKSVRTGSIVIPNGAVRFEGVSNHYSPIEYPAVPDSYVLGCLKNGIDKAGFTNKVGICITKANFLTQYAKNKRPVCFELEAKWNAFVAGNAICAEMGCAPLFIAGSALGVRTGAVLSIAFDDGQYDSDERVWNPDFELNAAKASIAGLKEIIESDRKKELS